MKPSLQDRTSKTKKLKLTQVLDSVEDCRTLVKGVILMNAFPPIPLTFLRPGK